MAVSDRRNLSRQSLENPCLDDRFSTASSDDCRGQMHELQ
jgi:hypothetical protein